MTHDRDYYRCLHTDDLVETARREGLNPEMAIAITERLAERLAEVSTIYVAVGGRGNFHFNRSEAQ